MQLGVPISQDLSKSWIEILTLIFHAAAVFVAVVGIVASILWQRALEKRRLKFDLFEKRYDVYIRLVTLANNVDGSIPSWSQENLEEYTRLMQRATFLFSKQTLDAFVTYERVMREVNTTVDEWLLTHQHCIDFTNDQRLEQVDAKLSAAKLMLIVFVETELSLVEVHKTAWLKLCDWVDRSEDVSSKDARQRMRLPF
jgi:hypothetical protein